MNQITIRNIDDAVVSRLRQLAWQEGVPLEESLRRLLIESTRRPKFRAEAAYCPTPTD